MQFTQSKKIGIGIMVFQMIAICFIPVMAGAFAFEEGRPAKGIEGPCHHPPGPSLGMWRDPRMIQQLELTEAQINQLREADFAAREEGLALKAQLDGLRLKMDQAFTEETIDAAAIRDLAVKMSEVKGKMFVQRIESRLTLAKILNQNQLDELKMYAKHPKKRGPRHNVKQLAPGQPAEKPEN